MWTLTSATSREYLLCIIHLEKYLVCQYLGCLILSPILPSSSDYWESLDQVLQLIPSMEHTIGLFIKNHLTHHHYGNHIFDILRWQSSGPLNKGGSPFVDIPLFWRCTHYSKWYSIVYLTLFLQHNICQIYCTKSPQGVCIIWNNWLIHDWAIQHMPPF